MISLNRYLSVAVAFSKLHNSPILTSLIIDQTNFFFEFKRTPGLIYDWMKNNKVAHGKYRMPTDVPDCVLPDDILPDFGCNIRIQLNRATKNKDTTIIFLNNEERKITTATAEKVIAILDAIKPELRLTVQNMCIQSYSNLMKVANIQI
jgi:hypothetical protein